MKNISPKMRIVQEEVFGPVAPILTVNDEDEAIKLANDTQYGLGASLWTQDLENAEKLSRQISSGIVSVNNVVASESTIWRCEEKWLWKRVIKIRCARVCKHQISQIL
jgi:acyl-CoA reductase-like NAD-dependent aldehyde dehydrogenase